MENYFFLILVAVVGVIRWLSQAAENKRNAEAAKRSGPPSATKSGLSSATFSITEPPRTTTMTVWISADKVKGCARASQTASEERWAGTGESVEIAGGEKRAFMG